MVSLSLSLSVLRGTVHASHSEPFTGIFFLLLLFPLVLVLKKKKQTESPGTFPTHIPLPFFFFYLKREDSVFICTRVFFVRDNNILSPSCFREEKEKKISSSTSSRDQFPFPSRSSYSSCCCCKRDRKRWFSLLLFFYFCRRWATGGW